MLDFQFSVLLPIYYKENPEYFTLALESLRNQTLPPTEVVIVKDGPLPKSLEDVIVGFVELLPLKVFALEKNLGLGNALDFGLRKCSHEHVARMDSDDICARNRFEKQADIFLASPGLDILGSYLNEFVHEIGDLNVIRRVPLTHDRIHDYTFYRCPFNHPTVMFRKSAVLKAGSYKRMPFFEDYYLWIRMAVAGCTFRNTEEILLHYRIGNNMISRRHGLEYARFEQLFFISCYREGLITKVQLLRFFGRFPLRILPIGMLKKFYDLALRK